MATKNLEEARAAFKIDASIAVHSAKLEDEEKINDNVPRTEADSCAHGKIDNTWQHLPTYVVARTYMKKSIHQVGLVAAT